MVNDEILTRAYEIALESLWQAVKQGLSDTEGVVVKKFEEEEHRATFTTSVSWTSWGENMVATVAAGQPAGVAAKGDRRAPHIFYDHEMGRRTSSAPSSPEI